MSMKKKVLAIVCAVGAAVGAIATSAAVAIKVHKGKVND